MNLSCPSCGASMDLDVLFAHEDSRAALARLALVSIPLGKVVLQYVRLFKPATRALAHSRTVRLIEELLPDIERGAITHRGREWAAPRDSWRMAMEKVLDQRDKLTLPLPSHAYLYTVLMSQADQAEAAFERDGEAQRRHASRAEAEPVADVPHRPAAAPSAPAYSGPSRTALAMQAQIAAATARRRAGDVSDESSEP